MTRETFLAHPETAKALANLNKLPHEKKISELDYIVGCLNQTASPEEGIPKRILKQWAIAKNKNCECINKGKRCKACAERMVDFEITKEELQ